MEFDAWIVFFFYRLEKFMTLAGTDVWKRRNLPLGRGVDDTLRFQVWTSEARRRQNAEHQKKKRKKIFMSISFGFLMSPNYTDDRYKYIVFVSFHMS